MPKPKPAAKTSTTKAAGSGATKKKTTTTTSTSSKAKTGLKKGTGLKKKVVKKKGPSAEELELQKKQNDAALVIQSSFRGFKTKKAEEEARKAREQVERDMEELRKQAWLAEIERQRKIDAERRKKMMEEAKRRKEEVSLRKKLLEMAYDGETEDLEKNWPRAKEIFGDHACAEVADGHGTTLLSEAAAGGATECLKWLLERGAHPNSLGEFARTPIWRSCFLGHADCVRELLEAGGDPRIASESGETAKNVASTDEIKQILEEWDVGKTEALAAAFERKAEERALEEQKQKEQMMEGLAGDVAEAEKENQQAQKILRNAHQEHEKRIFEYDTCVQEGKPQSLLDAALTSIKEAEHNLEQAKSRADVARETLQMCKLSLREKEMEMAGQEGAAGESEEELGIYVEMKDLDDVLIKDVGDKVRSTGKAVCCIDISKQASVFLRYLDTNYVNCLSRNHMDADRLRRSIVGSVRYGKPLILDLMDVDIWESVRFDLELVKKGLVDMLLDGSILKEENYMSLVKESDGEEYHFTKFQDDRIAKFRLILLTAERFPTKEITDRTYNVRVVLKGQ